MSNPKPLEHARSPILRGSLPALRRAGEKARALAASAKPAGTAKTAGPSKPGEAGGKG